MSDDEFCKCRQCNLRVSLDDCRECGECCCMICDEGCTTWHTHEAFVVRKANILKTKVDAARREAKEAIDAVLEETPLIPDLAAIVCGYALAPEKKEAKVRADDELDIDNSVCNACWMRVGRVLPPSPDKILAHACEKLGIPPAVIERELVEKMASETKARRAWAPDKKDKTIGKKRKAVGEAERDA